VSIAYWVCAAVTVISAMVSLGYSIAALGTADPGNRTASRYAAARSLALAFTAVAACVFRSEGFLMAVALAMVIVQTVDALIGAADRDRLKTYGPAATALIDLATLLWLGLS
jgi:hypothetical protein